MYCHEKTSCGGNPGGQRSVLPDRILLGIPSHGRASRLFMAWLARNVDGLKHHAGELEDMVDEILWIHSNCPSDASLQVDAITVRLDCIRGLLDLGRGWELQP